VFDGCPASIERELYGATWRQVIDRLHGVPSETRSVMVIGHNPAMQMLTLKLTTKGGSTPPHDDPNSPLAQIERKFPTGALATLRLTGGWPELAPNTATLLDYVRPKGLG
jgi:phosphohistidine phosphatase